MQRIECAQYLIKSYTEIFSTTIQQLLVRKQRKKPLVSHQSASGERIDQIKKRKKLA
jgi:hypothetical protein